MARQLSSPGRRLLLLALVLPLVLLWACTTEPLSPVSEFEYEFDFEPPDLGEEVDTTTVEVEFEEVEEDTTYIENQRSFSSDVTASAQTNQRPETLIDAGQAAADALDDEDETELADIDERADDAPEAVADNLEAAMQDTTSQQAQLAQRVQNAAAQHSVLANLLGLAESTSGRISAVGEPLALPEPDPGVSFDFNESFGVLACEDDAEAQFDTAVDRITNQRDQRLATIEDTYSRSVDKVETLRDQQLQRALERRLERRREAVDFYVAVRNAIATLLDAGVITAEEARESRLANTVFLIVNVRKAVTLHNRRVEQINEDVDDALARAEAKRESQRENAIEGFDRALEALEAALERALDRCHDQGQTTG